MHEMGSTGIDSTTFGVKWGEDTGNSQCMWAGLQEESMRVCMQRDFSSKKITHITLEGPSPEIALNRKGVFRVS